MKFTLATVFAAYVALVTAQDTSISAVVDAFNSANIPSDLHITFDPSSLLEVTFPQTSGQAITLNAGVQLPRDETRGPPTFAASIITASAGQKFVVAAVDPDAPTPQNPTSAQIRHFLGGDFVLGSDGQLTSPNAPISAFRQPTPPAGSPAHRYIFLLFNQPAGFDTQTVVTPGTSTANFNISAFAEQVGLGSPIAGTFMLVAPATCKSSH